MSRTELTGEDADIARELRSLLHQVTKHEEIYVRRKRVPQRGSGPSRPPPGGFRTWDDYNVESLVLNRHKLGNEGTVELFMDGLRHDLSKLRTYRVRRSGVGSYKGSPDDPSLDRAVGIHRDRARTLFREGWSYEFILWLVATWGSVENGGELTRRKAHALKKSVDRALEEVRHQISPNVQRSWWRLEKAFRPCEVA